VPYPLPPLPYDPDDGRLHEEEDEDEGRLHEEEDDDDDGLRPEPQLDPPKLPPVCWASASSGRKATTSATSASIFHA
jgi:hypothetical protein